MNRTYGTRRLAVLVTGSIFLMSSLATAAPPKVVVVPLGGSKVAGTNGQVQYNDNGKLAGAEVHYDKNTGKLEVKGEIRSTDVEGNNRLWGEGRPGVSVPGWTAETTKGYKQGRSNQTTAWDNSQAGCPQGTWVCTKDEWDGNFGFGGVTPRYVMRFTYDGARGTFEEDYLRAWLADPSVGDIQMYSIYGIILRYHVPTDVTHEMYGGIINYFPPLCCKHP